MSVETVLGTVWPDSLGCSRAVDAIGSDVLEPLLQFPQHQVVAGGDHPPQLFERPDCCDVVRCFAGNGQEFLHRLIVLPLRQQCATKGEARRRIRRMSLEAGPADPNRVVYPAGAAVFLGELCEGDRRRVVVDPALEICDSGFVGHGGLLSLNAAPAGIAILRS
jgi:hypothetical protein